MTIYGVDQSAFPGAAQMDWLSAQAGMRVTGFYLAPAPNHGDAGWMDRRAALAAAGWGFLPTYLGRQAASTHLDAPTAAADGQQAAQLMSAAGFPAGSVVYLDIETGGALAAPFQAYVQGWISAVEAAGLKAGIYCSHNLLAWALEQTPVVWTYHLPAGAAGTCDPAALPSGQIDAGAIATQYRQNVTLDGYGPTQVDLDLCLVADPSNFATIAHLLGRAPAAVSAA